MPSSRMTISMIDNSGETSTFRLYLPEITAANFDQVTGDDAVTDAYGRIHAAIATVSKCNFVKETIIGKEYRDLPVVPGDKEAQRELKALWHYVDTVNFRHGSFEVPGPDLNLLAEQGSNRIDLEEVTAAAFKAVIEGNCVSPDGNPIQITRAEIVGRNI